MSFKNLVIIVKIIQVL